MEVPLVVFVNTKSGGLQGAKIINKLKKCIPPENVFDLSQGGPLPGLQKYRGQKYRILVCGGDGSVGWVLTEIDKLKLSRDTIPPVAILPIGTGNDLSRVLKWGGSHNGNKMQHLISKVEKACVVMLDKWLLNYAGEALPHNQHFMHNYFSVGADAHIALQFHEMRLAHPEKFTSRTQNLAWYVRLGLQNLSPELITPYVSVEINGKKAELPEQTRCVVVLNLPSYSGGGNPWGTKQSKVRKFEQPKVDDGLLEVVAVNGPLQLVGIHANIIRGKRLGQGNLIKITTSKQIPAQVDGEPWSQPPSVITIQFSGKSRMLANSPPAQDPSRNLHHAPSTTSLVREKSELVVARSISSSTLVRSRSVSSPVAEHTPSPINYGPVQLSKRKNNRLYCDSCGLEFYLPYMLANHHNNGLCVNGGASSVRMPGTPPPILSVQLGDGASQGPSSRDEWSKSEDVFYRREEAYIESPRESKPQELYEPIEKFEYAPKAEPEQKIEKVDSKKVLETRVSTPEFKVPTREESVPLLEPETTTPIPFEPSMEPPTSTWEEIKHEGEEKSDA